MERTFPTDDCRHIATNSCHSLNDKIHPAYTFSTPFENVLWKHQPKPVCFLQATGSIYVCVCVCVCVYLNWVRGLVCDSRPKFSPACQNWALSLHKTNLPMKPTETCTQASTQILTESWIANTDGLPAGYRTQTKFSSAQIHCGFFSSIRDQKGAMGSLMVWEHPLWPTWLLGTL